MPASKIRARDRRQRRYNAHETPARMPYAYDVFLSYHRRSPVGDWVRNHFHPRLQEWLAESCPFEPRIFVDWQQETGVHWPENLRLALRQSKCLIAVWSPRYFRSPWCRAELESMWLRERHLQLGTPARPRGLVFPVVFNDGAHFPDAANAVQQRDFKRWNFPEASFENTAAYLDFVGEVQSFAAELATWLEHPPDYSDDWPTVTPPAVEQPTIELPRL